MELNNLSRHFTHIHIQHIPAVTVKVTEAAAIHPALKKQFVFLVQIKKKKGMPPCSQDFLFLAMQKILITGANGFVAYYLVKQLLESNHFIIATGKGNCRLPFASSHFIYETLDFTNDEEVSNIFEKHQPSIVVHCGAMSKPDECELNKEAAFRTNVSGTINLLNAAEKWKSFFIFLSTDFVFSGEEGMYKEDDERAPVNYYGQTKLLAEDEVQQYKWDWAIVRTILVYGKPFLSRQNILTNVANALQKGEQLKIFDDQVRTPTYVEDLANAIITIINKKARGIFHISGEDVMTPYRIAIAVAHHFSFDASLIQKVSEKDFDQPARRPLKTGFVIAKAKSELHYSPVSFEEGLRRTFE
jgi:dTDP-4-dehydrorhamnose reductase